MRVGEINIQRPCTSTLLIFQKSGRRTGDCCPNRKVERNSWREKYLNVFTGCPRIFRNKNKTFIRLCKTVFCQKIRPLCQLGKVNSIYYDIGLNKQKGPANVGT